ncbi:HAD-IIB family hydrolase [Rhizobium herbae]|uniref:Mannosylfructose-6-phosphate phosphatase n=1 Tax=Rhizobium herbae TaxID=508661 RepID=A0ABS4EGE0_9HYPH|nr:HAD-IIB family hydrolase [Rhizobium herbae]MBP1857008.1 mannosylfructose-6-phosphate phosphatase [Rhizobium herbae]
MRRVRIFCSDIDGTLAGNSDAEARFRDAWQSLPEEDRPLLVLNSGRLIEDQQTFIPTTALPKPDVYIGGVGTMLHHQKEPSHAELYSRSMGSGFDRERIAKALSDIPEVTVQPDAYQHAQKSSWYLRDADAAMLAAIEGRLASAGIAARLVYSSNRDLDILPDGVDKGAALSWLCRQLGLSHDDVVVAGDTGNDRSMFELPGVRGIVVGNALPELKAIARDRPDIYCAEGLIADGVLEGLTYWGVFRQLS